MITYKRYKPQEIPTGYRLEIIDCPKCNGVRFFSGRYGMTACEECSNGKKYRLVKLRNTKK